MKTIRVVELKNYRGGALLIPQFDEMGEIKGEVIKQPNGEAVIDPSTGEPIKRPLNKPGTILDAIDFLLQDFPRNKFTMKVIIEASRVAATLQKTKDDNLDEIQLEDSSYDWLIAVLKDDNIGAKMFGLNLLNILTALESKQN